MLARTEPADADGARGEAPAASTTAGSGGLPASPGSQHVRIALSPAAEQLLAELRVRRLLAVELGRRIRLDRTNLGPLDDELVQVWVDLVEDRITLQVRRAGRALAHRSIEVRGYPADLAAHTVALETAEMVRVQAHTSLPDPCGTCRVRSTPPSDALAGAGIAASAAVRWLPASRTSTFTGSALELGQRLGPLRTVARAEWLAALGGEAPTRWLGATLGLDLPVTLRAMSATTVSSGDVRVAAGAQVGLASLEAHGAAAGERWLATTSARLTAQIAVQRGVWAGLSVEPGAVLHPTDDAAAGFVLGAGLSLAAGPTR
ncbi:MAG: hypothetical protein FJ096_21135 [Deltaproteobacteria bacterium]|nr:hypothetical protein [Deltaproteobacteria bacterium]